MRSGPGRVKEEGVGIEGVWGGVGGSIKVRGAKVDSNGKERK